MSNERLTVLHTIETDGPGGAETLVLKLACGLDPNRFRSIALLPLNSWLAAELAKAGIETFQTVYGKWFDPRPVQAMRHLVKEQQVDLIHSHLPRQNFYSSVVGRLTGTPSVITYHGPVELQHADSFKEKIQLSAVRHSASRFLVVSDQMTSALQQAGFRRESIVRIYNGVDVAEYSAQPNGFLRGIIGADENAPIVGMVANIRAPKGYESFIRAAHMVSQKFPATRFVSIGQEEAGLFERLQALVRELGMENRFTFLGFRSDVPRLLCDFSVFVLSSLSEGFPFAAIEAMASGKPSVMTRCGGPQEIAEDGVTGYLVPVADTPALAEKISLLLAAPEWAREMGQNARNKVLRLYTLQAMLASYENFYAKLCGRNGAPVEDVAPRSVAASAIRPAK